MKWDKEVAEEARKRAIQSIDEFVPGNKYYRNLGEAFHFSHVVTWKGMHDFTNPELFKDQEYSLQDLTEPAWIITLEGTTVSLHDNNIGASYNPWFIFDNEADAKWASLENLKVRWDADEWGEDDLFYFD